MTEHGSQPRKRTRRYSPTRLAKQPVKIGRVTVAVEKHRDQYRVRIDSDVDTPPQKPLG